MNMTRITRADYTEMARQTGNDYVCFFNTNLGSFFTIVRSKYASIHIIGDDRPKTDHDKLFELASKAVSGVAEEVSNKYFPLTVRHRLLEVVPARLDADGTAKPLSRIVHHPGVDMCIGPGMPLHRPEYEDEKGDRTPLTGAQNPPLTIFEVIKNMDDVEGRGPERVIGCFTNNKEAVRAAYKQGPMGYSDAKVSMREVHATCEDWLKSHDGAPYAGSHQTLDPNDRLRNRALAKLTPEERHALGLLNDKP